MDEPPVMPTRQPDISDKAALGAAAGIGSAAILAALLYVGRKKSEPAH